MKRAQHRVEPVLAAMRDIVLALKHQLNAKAIGSIRGELSNVEREVDALIDAMNRSNEQAGQFLRRLDDEARGVIPARGAEAAMQRTAIHPAADGCTV